MDPSTPPALPSAAADGAALPPAPPTRPAPSIWTRPVSYRAQCWVAWAGLTAFGIRGVVAMRAGGAPDIERLVAVALSVVWGIDLLRGRSAER